MLKATVSYSCSAPQGAASVVMDRVLNQGTFGPDIPSWSWRNLCLPQARGMAYVPKSDAFQTVIKPLDIFGASPHRAEAPQEFWPLTGSMQEGARYGGT